MRFLEEQPANAEENRMNNFYQKAFILRQKLAKLNIKKNMDKPHIMQKVRHLEAQLVEVTKLVNIEAQGLGFFSNFDS